MFGRRADGTRVENIPTLRRFMPYVSPRRNDSLFYMFQDIRVDAALEYLEKKNCERPVQRPITLFHLMLRATGNICFLRPGINRFVKGGKLWDRNHVSLTFSAKREIVDGSPLLTIKRRFLPDESLEEMVDGIYDRLESGRGGKKTTADKEMGIMVRLPGFAIRAAMGFVRAVDSLGLLPASFIEGDPLFTSIFMANLGSINYPAGFHHLWEYGTASCFGVMGKIEFDAEKRRKIVMAWTYDERIEDGLYSYHSMEIIRKKLEHPELLELSVAELERKDWTIYD